jgi:dihydroxyacetone kinase
MSDIRDKLLAKMPIHLMKFLDSLTGNELNELDKLDKRLIAKIYQAGAQFSIDAVLEIKDEEAKL